MSNKNIHDKKNKTFLHLIKTYRTHDTDVQPQLNLQFRTYLLSFEKFLKVYTNLLNIVYVYNYIYKDNLIKKTSTNIFLSKLISFYSHFSNINYTSLILNDVFTTNSVNNSILFFKPKKQMFVVFFKNQPKFIFTGGLMRKVMNEKRKSSKKLYKVAVSVIKLATILLFNKTYFSNCYLKLKNIGQLRGKILNIFLKHNLHKRINYVIVCPRLDTTAQKFDTRRSIKKYVKKRFKLNT